MTWRSNLHFYSVGTPTKDPINQYLAFVEEIIPRLVNDQPRVVNLSIELAKSSRNPQLAELLSKEFQELLADAPSMLIVKAAGNDGGVMTPDAIAAQPGGGLLILDALLRTRQAGLRDRVILVGGTEWTTNGVRVEQSFRYIDGETDIVAPARDVRLLGGAPYATEVVDQSGTSFAAPMVAGVAAQLLAMQPNLTPAQVKQFILAGAQEPRLDPLTGLTIGPEQLRLTRAGATQSVFQLDAYGALTLLSRSDPATPICGFPVVTSFVENPTTGELETSVRIARPGAPLEVYRGEVASVTVAQGGRRIGIDDYTTSRDKLHQNGSWSGTHNVAFRGYRQFLERDTAFIDYSTGPELLTIRGAAGPRGPFNVCEDFAGQFGTACYSGPIAGTGEWAHITVSRNNYDLTGCGPTNGFYGSYLVPVGTGTRAPLRETTFEPCAPEAGAWNVPGESVLAWRSDGAVAWAGQSDVSYFISQGNDDPLDPNPPPSITTTTGMQTAFRQVSVVSGLTVLGERTVNNRFSYALGWRADGASLISYEFANLDWSDCQRTVRAGLAPETEITDSAGPVPWCGNAVMEPLPASRLGAPLASALRAKGTGAAQAGRAPSAAELRLRALGRRQVPRIVLVN